MGNICNVEPLSTPDNGLSIVEGVVCITFEEEGEDDNE